MSQIQSLVDQFVRDLEAAIRQEALASVRAVLESSLGDSKPAKAGKATAVAKPADAPRGRRTAKDIQADADRLYLAIKAKPGSTAEQLKAAARIKSEHFGLPIAALLKAKRVKKSGLKRATKYHVA